LAEYPIAAIVGHFRRESFNRNLANAVVKFAPPAFSFTQLRIDDLPPCNRDARKPTRL
jgi:chromate reductase